MKIFPTIILFIMIQLRKSWDVGGELSQLSEKLIQVQESLKAKILEMQDAINQSTEASASIINDMANKNYEYVSEQLRSQFNNMDSIQQSVTDKIQEVNSQINESTKVFKNIMINKFGSYEDDQQEQKVVSSITESFKILYDNGQPCFEQSTEMKQLLHTLWNRILMQELESAIQLSMELIEKMSKDKICFPLLQNASNLAQKFNNIRITPIQVMSNLGYNWVTVINKFYALTKAVKNQNIQGVKDKVVELIVVSIYSSSGLIDKITSSAFDLFKDLIVNNYFDDQLRICFDQFTVIQTSVIVLGETFTEGPIDKNAEQLRNLRYELFNGIEKCKASYQYYAEFLTKVDGQDDAQDQDFTEQEL